MPTRRYRRTETTSIRVLRGPEPAATPSRDLRRPDPGTMPSRRLRRVLTAAALAAVLAAPAAAQQPATTPAARPADVASIDAILTALYDVISGPKGQARDWDRFYSLFFPGARLIPTGRGPDGSVRARALTPEEYRQSSGAQLEERGFFEVEIGRTVEEFGNIAHAFSAYASRWTLEDPEPFSRGINSIQLLNDGNRWWVVSVFWDSERSGNPIPDRYIRK